MKGGCFEVSISSLFAFFYTFIVSHIIPCVFIHTMPMVMRMKEKTLNPLGQIGSLSNLLTASGDSARLPVFDRSANLASSLRLVKIVFGRKIWSQHNPQLSVAPFLSSWVVIAQNYLNPNWLTVFQRPPPASSIRWKEAPDVQRLSVRRFSETHLVTRWGEWKMSESELMTLKALWHIVQFLPWVDSLFNEHYRGRLCS